MAVPGGIKIATPFHILIFRHPTLKLNVSASFRFPSKHRRTKKRRENKLRQAGQVHRRKPNLGRDDDFYYKPPSSV